jgi:hypothetical protein
MMIPLHSEILSAVKKNEFSQVPVAHSNPSFSGGRSQEDRSSKPAQANSSQDPISKNPSQKFVFVKVAWDEKDSAASAVLNCVFKNVNYCSCIL